MAIGSRGVSQWLFISTGVWQLVANIIHIPYYLTSSLVCESRLTFEIRRMIEKSRSSAYGSNRQTTFSGEDAPC